MLLEPDRMSHHYCILLLGLLSLEPWVYNRNILPSYTEPNSDSSVTTFATAFSFITASITCESSSAIRIHFSSY
ncbi:hypothetical protein BpHYR1_030708 [Brachionus plicatilis]|uniref:Uncharacterized protein n=1 Tax=Brachionus plicatilis TaxID=10195 RepID=A0A3M7PL04_BRAPC|nr:hypothetical protein BpHYR1_030708 [Brachionus plicatilis]